MLTVVITIAIVAILNTLFAVVMVNAFRSYASVAPTSQVRA